MKPFIYLRHKQKSLIILLILFLLSLLYFLVFTQRTAKMETNFFANSSCEKPISKSYIESVFNYPNWSKERKNIELIVKIKLCKVDFLLDDKFKEYLISVNATDLLIQIIRDNYFSSLKGLIPPVVPSSKGFTNPVGMEFVLIYKGFFQMGSERIDSERSNADIDDEVRLLNDKEPVHPVRIGYGFYVGKYEVTLGEWKKVMGDLTKEMKKNLPEKFKENDRQPITMVTWYDAQNFIKKLNEQNDGYKYRLPSEAEWEYIARTGSKAEEFFFGETLNLEQANFRFSTQTNERATENNEARSWWQKTVNVGSYPPNDWGLYDLHGNVREWVEDIYTDNYRYEGKLTNGKPNTAVGDPRTRVLRGGSWNSDRNNCRSAYRYPFQANGVSDSFGFRVVAVVSK